MPDPQTYHEQELFKLVAQGDHPAFRVLVDRYWNNLYAQSMVYLKNSYKAQDIVQEVFLSVWKNKSSLLDVESPANYLFILTRNRIVSELRKKLTVGLEDHADIINRKTAALPDDILADKQLNELIQQAIRQMPPQRRAVFEMSRKEGLKYEEIAALLGISRETVKGHIIKALAFIRTFIRHHLQLLLIFFSAKFFL